MEHNGSITPVNGKLGGQGDLVDPHHSRESLRMIRSAVLNGWHIPVEWRKQLPVVAHEIANAEGASHRDRIAALRVLQAMGKDNIEAAVALDKIERLDDEKPTERVEQRHFVVPPPRVLEDEP